MTHAIAWFVATLVTIPLLGWYLVYIITVKISRNKRKAVRLAADSTTLLFMVAVYFLMQEIWSKSFLWMILTIFFLVAILFTWLHWKVANDIYVRKLFRGIWRVNFLLFFFLHIILSGYGLFARILAL
ncbi:DUF3397 domain-containing protein [Halalkalibacterium ligniniphilum]|uniref:DUF3397 domain-containing protein n=1 Tax=Halalkalibacterium ligniniphilum TaxID=1134413 RepID=UPI00034CC1DF|nr:DUF3397 domain-containing protein [Halalkalibacterium ligniniphilum]